MILAAHPRSGVPPAVERFAAGLLGCRCGVREDAGRSWQADGTLSARYRSEASKERVDPAGIFYFWHGERPRHPDAPQLGNRRDQAGERGSRRRLLHDTLGRCRGLPRPNLGHLPPRRPRGRGRPGRDRRLRAGRTHHAAARGVELAGKLLTSGSHAQTFDRGAGRSGSLTRDVRLGRLAALFTRPIRLPSG